VRTICQALDLEGTQLREGVAEDGGTRHRSAYRLAGALPGVLIVVVSQDGGVRFVSSRKGRVLYWEQ
jgi:DNA integrity scanning protein DisA with diadenylate cyclase activity